MTDSDKTALYNYIISNSDLVSTTLSNTVRLEKENISNYESIRELEKQISDMELEINRKEMGRDYSESAKNADDSDLKELKEKLEVFKVHSANIFDNIKSNNKFITNWKKNITVYLMAECYEIENDIKEQIKNEPNQERKADLIDWLNHWYKVLDEFEEKHGKCNNTNVNLGVVQ